MNPIHHGLSEIAKGMAPRIIAGSSDVARQVRRVTLPHKCGRSEMHLESYALPTYKHKKCHALLDICTISVQISVFSLPIFNFTEEVLVRRARSADNHSMMFEVLKFLCCLSLA